MQGMQAAGCIDTALGLTHQFQGFGQFALLEVLEDRKGSLVLSKAREDPTRGQQGTQQCRPRGLVPPVF
jgi:hypothetical protein